MNIKISQCNNKKFGKRLEINTKVLISDYFNKIGNKLTKKYGKACKYIIPGTIVGNGFGNSYPISIDIEFNDLKKNDVYNVDYKLVKAINDNAYNKFVNDNINILNSKTNSMTNEDNNEDSSCEFNKNNSNSCFSVTSEEN